MTTTTDTAALVEAVREGDLSAFDQLVQAHQDAAYAYALVLTKNTAAAQDAVQDAFLDAFLRLPQLREAAAFRAWLRRIVFKHCDRQRRRPRPTQEVATPAVAAADEAFEAREQRARMFDVIEQLPEHERFVVALHYLGDQPVQAIADFLALTPSAVKKRLHSARKRLRTLEETMTNVPAQPFAHRIQLFLAVRSGDREVVDRILTERPDLLETSERWTDEEALAGGFTLAHEQTPLILAAGLGDDDMVALLLERGAQPDGRCTCDNDETALWAAARAGHHVVVDRLLKAGADPAATNHKGYDAAALAQWRGDAALAERLGTAPGASEASWSLVDPARDRLQTGIRALDLWMPIREGAVVRVHGAAETGLTVLLAELTAAVGAAGGITLWTGWQRHPWERRELSVLAARTGVDAHTEVMMRPGGTARGEVLPEALKRLAELRANKPVVAHVIFEQEGHASEVEAMAPQLRDAATITFVVRPWRLVTKGELDAPDDTGPFDATIVTDPRLAAQWIFPAVDPQRTSSRLPDTDVARRARRLLADYAALDPQLARDVTPEDTPEAATTVARARRLLACLTQPFFTATPDTGWPGVRVSLGDTETEVAALLAGAEDDTEVAALRYRRG